MSMIKDIAIQNYLTTLGIAKASEEIMAGLTARQKYIPSKYFYDTRGSELFEEITSLEEYYPTRMEKQILSNILDRIPIKLCHLNIIELGSGDPSKISLLLRQIPENTLRTISYYPVDICEMEIVKCVDQLSHHFPLNSISGIVADFHHQLHVLPKNENRLFCFFGGTIGNFTAGEAESFVRRLEREMRPGDRLLLGVDMVKDISVVERAYNDAEGVTAKFNLNILNAINRIIGTDFNPDEFEHVAFYNKDLHRIEMHLRARKNIEIRSHHTDKPIRIKQDETIHTENCHKFNYAKIKQICSWGCFQAFKVCHDPRNWFGVVYAVK